MTEKDSINEALAANYMLVEHVLRSWSGRVTDKAVGEEVVANKGAVKGSGKFIKYLFAKADAELLEVQSAGALVRTFIYSKTVPWSGNTDGAKRGPRLIAATQAIDFLRDLNRVKRDYDAAVQKLVLVWQARKVEAIANLNGLADPSDYPDESDVTELFGVTVDLRPVPTMADFTRVNVPSELAIALGQRHAEQEMVHLSNAMDDLKGRLLKELNRMAKQLGKAAAGERTRLYDTLVTNMQGLVPLLRTMNVSKKPELTELADRIERELLTVPVETYRDDKAKATVVAAAAQQIAVDAAMESIWNL